MKEGMNRIARAVAFRVRHPRSGRKTTVDIIVNDIILALDDALPSFPDDAALKAAELCYVRHRLIESSNRIITSLTSSNHSSLAVENTSLEIVNSTSSRNTLEASLSLVRSPSIALVNDSSSELFELTDLFEVDMNHVTQKIGYSEARRKKICICSKDVSDS